MKKLSILCMCALVIALVTGPAIAQQYEVDVHPPDGVYGDTLISTTPGSQVCFDVALTGSPVDNPGSGGVFMTYTPATGVIAYASAVSFVPPWTAGPTVNDPLGPGSGTFFDKVANLGLANVSNPSGTLPITTICMDAPGGGTANIDLTAAVAPAYWPAPLDDATINANTASPTLVIDVVCACTTDVGPPGIGCDPVDWCSGGSGATCIDCACVGGDPAPCDDGNVCTVDPCDAGSETCGEKTCDVSQLTGATAPCCSDPICVNEVICGAEVTLIKETGYYQPPASDACEDRVTIKNKVCMSNPDVLVGGIQFDLCDSPDCLECINCELTERTVMFDCIAVELPNGCCRVIMFCKNPGCAINPGLCDVATVVQQTKCDPIPDGCGVCIEEGFENIIASDYNGFDLAEAGIGSTLCPVICGDICPPGTGSGNDCGDGVVDIYDIMCEVNLALAADLGAAPGSPEALGNANECQQPRADVPTGTPPVCADPDGYVTIMDVMVLIDSALNRQDCCSFYYLGIIY